MFGISKTMLGTMGAIIATGAVLNLAGSGKLGKLPQQFAQFITKGYGV